MGNTFNLFSVGGSLDISSRSQNSMVGRKYNTALHPWDWVDYFPKQLTIYIQCKSLMGAGSCTCVVSYSSLMLFRVTSLE